MMFDALSAEFPRSAVSWRAQTVTKDGTKALALAYIDARDVMDRLDEVCGPENWSDRYEFHGSRTVCYLSIRVDGEWIVKADGAGDSDVEAEKGAISDALKRAAVKWGIGRYLYHIEAPWVPCECSEFNGKKQWKRWTGDPWQFVRNMPAPATPQKPAPADKAKQIGAAEQKRQLLEIDNDLLDAHSEADVKRVADIWQSIAARDGWSRDYKLAAKEKFDAKRETLRTRDVVDDIEDAFPGSRVVNETLHPLMAGE